MYELLKIAPGVIGKVDPKKKDTAKLLDAIFKLPDMFGGAFKSSSIGTSTTTEGTDLRNPLTIDGVDQVLNRNIAQGLFGNTGNNKIASIYDPLDFFS